MWIKLLLSGLVIAFCVMIGYVAAEKYRSRKKFYAQFADFNDRYLNELAYARKPLGEFLRAYNYSGEFQRAIECMMRHETIPAFGFLTKEERAQLCDYFSMLGRGDAASQRGYFSAQRDPLVTLKEQTARECKSRGELYLKLGLLFGLAVIILML